MRRFVISTLIIFLMLSSASHASDKLKIEELINFWGGKSDIIESDIDSARDIYINFFDHINPGSGEFECEGDVTLLIATGSEKSIFWHKSTDPRNVFLTCGGRAVISHITAEDQHEAKQIIIELNRKILLLARESGISNDKGQEPRLAAVNNFDKRINEIVNTPTVGELLGAFIKMTDESGGQRKYSCKVKCSASSVNGEVVFTVQADNYGHAHAVAGDKLYDVCKSSGWKSVKVEFLGSSYYCE